MHRLFFEELVQKTNNFGDVTWLGNPIWQNVLDLWTLQEAMAQIRPSVVLETGTNRGGSPCFTLVCLTCSASTAAYSLSILSACMTWIIHA